MKMQVDFDGIEAGKKCAREQSIAGARKSILICNHKGYGN
jgi:hypothetical protein